jgi:hypothetical protein
MPVMPPRTPCLSEFLRAKRQKYHASGDSVEASRPA